MMSDCTAVLACLIIVSFIVIPLCYSEKLTEVNKYLDEDEPSSSSVQSVVGLDVAKIDFLMLRHSIDSLDTDTFLTNEMIRSPDEENRMDSYMLPINSLIKASIRTMHVKNDFVNVEFGDLDQRVAFGMFLLASNDIAKAFEVFDLLLDESPLLLPALVGRFRAFCKINDEYVNSALNEISFAIQVDSSDHVLWLLRAEYLLSIDQYELAMSDVKQSLKLKETGRGYLFDGVIKFILEKSYLESLQSFHRSFELVPDLYEALFAIGLSLKYINRIDDARVILESAIEMKTVYSDCYRLLGEVYRTMGKTEQARKMFTFILDKDVSQIHYVNAHMSAGFLYHEEGRSANAIEHYRKCLIIQPGHATCQFLAGIEELTLGNYFEATRLFSYVSISDYATSWEINKSSFLLNFARTLHSVLDTPLSLYSLDSILHSGFKGPWVQSLSFDEVSAPAPPHLRIDVLPVSPPDYLRPEALELHCTVDRLAFLFQRQGRGIIQNGRYTRAMSFAALEIAQMARIMWLSPLSSSKSQFDESVDKTYLGGYRDLVSVAVKWRQYTSPHEPVLWLDMIDNDAVQSGYKDSFVFIRNQITNIRLAPYLKRSFRLLKKKMSEYYSDNNNMDSLTIRSKLKTIYNASDMLNFMDHSFYVKTTIPSFAFKDKRIESVMLTLSGEPELPNTLSFSIDSIIAHSHHDFYYLEMSYCWKRLSNEAHAHLEHPTKASAVKVTQLIVTFGYYFCHYRPISRDNGAIVHSIIIGLLMAVSIEVSQPIPKDKDIMLEAILSSSPQAFFKSIRSWLLPVDVGLLNGGYGVGGSLLLKPFTHSRYVCTSLRELIEILTIDANFTNCEDTKESSS